MHPALRYILVKQSIASNVALRKRPMWIICLLGRWVLNNCAFSSCSQEGRDFGDEYLAELDHIGEYSVVC